MSTRFIRIECTTSDDCNSSVIAGILRPKAQLNTLSTVDMHGSDIAFRITAVIDSEGNLKGGVVPKLIQALQNAGAKAITVSSILGFIP